MVGLDKAHAAHVRRQVEDLLATFSGQIAEKLIAQVELVELGAVVIDVVINVIRPVRHNLG